MKLAAEIPGITREEQAKASLQPGEEFKER